MAAHQEHRSPLRVDAGELVRQYHLGTGTKYVFMLQIAPAAHYVGLRLDVLRGGDRGSGR